MTDSYNGALIGCGFFAQNHLHGWADLPAAKLVAVCDLDADQAQRTAKAFGIAHHCTDAAEMLARHDLDFVDIATTAQSHRPLVELAVQHVGCVICQKPFAETLEDARAMVAATEAADATLIVHENFRWQKPFVTMKRLIDEGRIGTPQFARLSFRHDFDNYVNQPYLAKIERFTIMDVGLHLFDLARHLMGEAHALSCLTQRLNPRVRGEDAFTALIEHVGGASTVCDCSFYSHRRPQPFPRTLAEVEGPDGSLVLRIDGMLEVHSGDAVQRIDTEPAVPHWGKSRGTSCRTA